MSLPAEENVRVYPDLESLSRAVAESVADIAASSVSAGGWFSLAVSGGETPRALFRILREYDKRLSWPRVPTRRSPKATCR